MPALISAFYLSVFLLASSLLFSLMQQIMIGLELYTSIAKLSFISSFISIPIIWILINFLGLNGALIGIFAYQIVDFYIKRNNLKRNYLLSVGCKHSKELILSAKRIVYRCAPLFFSTLITVISIWYAKAYMTSNSGGFSHLAIFDTAQQWLSIIAIITGSTTSIIVPMLSKTISFKKENREIFHINIAINFLISVGIASVFFLFSEEIMSIYGESYIVGSTTLEILSMTSIFYTISSLFNKYMISHNRLWSVVTNSIFSSGALAIVLIIYVDLTSESLAYGLLSYYVISTTIYIAHYSNLKLHEYSKK